MEQVPPRIRTLTVLIDAVEEAYRVAYTLEETDEEVFAPCVRPWRRFWTSRRWPPIP